MRIYWALFFLSITSCTIRTGIEIPAITDKKYCKEIQQHYLGTIQQCDSDMFSCVIVMSKMGTSISCKHKDIEERFKQ